MAQNSSHESVGWKHFVPFRLCPNSYVKRRQRESRRSSEFTSVTSACEPPALCRFVLCWKAKGWWEHLGTVQWSAYTCKSGRAKPRCCWPRPPASSAGSSTWGSLGCEGETAEDALVSAALLSHPVPPAPAHRTRNPVGFGMKARLLSGKSQIPTVWPFRWDGVWNAKAEFCPQTTSARGEAPASCPKSVGFGHPNTPGRLLQNTLRCSYFDVLPFVLIRSNHHISQFPTMTVPSLGLGQATGAQHHPGARALEAVIQPEDQRQGDTLWSSMQLWELSECS